MPYKSAHVTQVTTQHHKKIQKVCDPAFQAFNLNFLYYNFITPTGKLISVGTHPEWMEHYYSSSLFSDNPFFCDPQHLREGFYPFQQSGSSNIQETCTLAHNKFHLSPTCAIFKKSSQGCAQLGLSFSDQIDLSTLRVVNESYLLQRFFDYFETELAFLITKAKECPIDLLQLKGDQFLEKPQYETIKISQNKKIKCFVDMNLLDPKILDLRFTRREQDCIELLLKNYTSKEMAKSLNISSRTIEYYIEKIRDKLGNSYRNELRQTLQIIKDLNLLEK